MIDTPVKIEGSDRCCFSIQNGILHERYRAFPISYCNIISRIDGIKNARFFSSCFSRENAIRVISGISMNICIAIKKKKKLRTYDSSNARKFSILPFASLQSLSNFMINRSIRIVLVSIYFDSSSIPTLRFIDHDSNENKVGRDFRSSKMNLIGHPNR